MRETKGNRDGEGEERRGGGGGTDYALPFVTLGGTVDLTLREAGL